MDDAGPPTLTALVALIEGDGDPLARLDLVFVRSAGRASFGPIELDCDVLAVQGADLRLIIFTSEPRSTAAEQFKLLDAIRNDACHAH